MCAFFQEVIFRNVIVACTVALSLYIYSGGARRKGLFIVNSNRMDSENFYVCLPSNSSLLAHAGNHGGSYTVDLPIPLQLASHGWEVALSQIVFSQDWPVLVKGDIWVTACVNDVSSGSWKTCQQTFPTAVELAGAEDSMEGFLKKTVAPLITRALTAADIKEVDVKFTRTGTGDKKRVSFTSPTTTESKTPVRLQLSDTLLHILGFSRTQLVDGVYFQTDNQLKFNIGPSRFAPSRRRSVQTLWIYSDIIHPYITGHMLTPLLRTVDVDSRVDYGTTRVVDFERLEYHRVNGSEINSIRIAIYNIGGKAPIEFATNVTCKLHFQRRRGPP